MTYTHTTLVANSEELELAKGKGINLSQFFRNALRIELEIDDISKDKNEERIKELKRQLHQALKINGDLKRLSEKLSKELEKERKKVKEAPEPQDDLPIVHKDEYIPKGVWHRRET